MSINIYKNDIYLNYKHPVMDLTDFNASYLNKLLENIFKEQNLFSYLETLMSTS